MNQTHDQLREIVRQKYAKAVKPGSDDCCGSCSDSEDKLSMIGDAYDGVDGYMEEADLGLGCGLPVEHAGLRPGMTVLDLGSGAGLDVFVARNEVGASGHVIGVDMTAEMIARARENAHRSGYSNVEFRLGEIEHLPVLSDSIDVVISNCVLNLVPDKKQAFAEIWRVLKPGGHFCVSDIVASSELPEWVKGIADAYAGCVAGAIPKKEYLRMVEEAGFRQIEIAKEKRVEIPDELLTDSLTPAQQQEITNRNLHVMSITVKAFKF